MGLTQLVLQPVADWEKSGLSWRWFDVKWVQPTLQSLATCVSGEDRVQTGVGSLPVPDLGKGRENNTGFVRDYAGGSVYTRHSFLQMAIFHIS